MMGRWNQMGMEEGKVDPGGRREVTKEIRNAGEQVSVCMGRITEGWVT